MWTNISYILHNDNAPSHKARVLTEFKANNVTNTIDQSSYSPDLASCDFFFTPETKIAALGNLF